MNLQGNESLLVLIQVMHNAKIKLIEAIFARLGCVPTQILSYINIYYILNINDATSKLDKIKHAFIDYNIMSHNDTISFEIVGKHIKIIID